MSHINHESPSLEEILTITQLAKRIGRTRVTVWGGVQVGSRTVKLDAIRIGRQWAVTQSQYESFIRDCNPERQKLPESPAKERARMVKERIAFIRQLDARNHQERKQS